MAATKVILTGVNGYIGSHILEVLLAHGLSVRGIVRSEQTADRVRGDFPNAGDRLDFTIVPDITKPGAYDEALQSDPSIRYIIHTASPLNYSSGKSVADFVQPAVQGTREMLNATARHGKNIQRVVITGSFSAIGNPKDMQGNGKVYTSRDWNPVTAEEVNAENPRLAYWFSKTLAERAAWDFMKTASRGFDLVFLNPPMVHGPLRHSVESIDDLNVTTANIWNGFLNGTAEIPLPAEWVHADIDVRDLAKAHYKAMFAESASNKRYLVTRGRICNQEISDLLYEALPEARHRIPRGQPGTSSLPKNAFDVDGSEAVKDLGLKFRPAKDTFRDLGRQLLDIEARSIS
ncbi:uncharacterized protein N7487_008928 [Penicillium crustosum]|uniref:uncharacterized protein n=1 Tax=Penicillium crustosum TaxID=36656 RepID=UPI00238595C1|nr:uncharacterized protein N7487_008928 [Penicillium crustosum]KAJ5403032.1 hypothetical protein N7487_008928 [Penicillium crustosum]